MIALLFILIAVTATAASATGVALWDRVSLDLYRVRQARFDREFDRIVREIGPIDCG